MTTDTARAAPDPLDGLADTLDRAASAATAQITSGLSPATMAQAFSDWWVHLMAAPGRQMELVAKGVRKVARLGDYVLRSAAGGHPAPAIEPLPQDRRFADPAWQKAPFDVIAQAFLLQQQWWHAATTGIGGVTRHHETVIEFAMRQMLDTASPPTSS